MMYAGSELLVWWAFVSGIGVIALLAGVFALVTRWAAPGPTERLR